MNDKLVFAVDLGTSKAICIAAGDDGHGGASIKAHAIGASGGVQKGMIVDPEAAGRVIDAVVSEVERAVEEKSSSIVMGINGVHVQAALARGMMPIYPSGRKLSREDVLQVVNHSRQTFMPPEREQIEAIPNEFVVDGQGSIGRPIGMKADRLEVSTCIVTGERDRIAAVERAVELSGRSISVLIATPFASAMAVMGHHGPSSCLVVDIGAATTGVSVFEKGAPAFLGVLPIGSSTVTSDIEKLLKTNPDEAERLKLNGAMATTNGIAPGETVDVLQIGQIHARPLDRKVLCEIVGSRVREIGHLVVQLLERQGLQAASEGDVFVTGGGAQIPGVVEAFTAAMPKGIIRAALPKPKGRGQESLSAMPYSAAVGMVKMAVQSEEEELAPASGLADWKERIRTFTMKLGGRS